MVAAQPHYPRSFDLLLSEYPLPAAGFFIGKRELIDPFSDRCRILNTVGSPVEHHLFSTSPPQLRLPGWSADELPFFCRIEHKWDKRTRVPLKFRLGSVDYVDWLEGKREF